MMRLSRREFLREAAAATVLAGGAAISAPPQARAAEAVAAPPHKSRVVVIRHDALAEAPQNLKPARVRELLDEAARALGGDAKAADAWARWFKPADRLGIKVNCLGHGTHPVVAGALAAAVSAAGLPPEQMVLWDRTNRELQVLGYELRGSGKGPRCFGTDALASRGSGGYAAEITTSGAIGSLFSRIVTDETTALVSAAVLKDHCFAGLTCTLKNFYGAIHNPNKYHDNNCDPFVADVCAAPSIRDRLRLAVIDATRPQFQGGPAARPQFQWAYGGLILATDLVAADRVALAILEKKRETAKQPPLDTAGRPVRYLASAQARGLGAADLGQIDVVSLGRPWLDVG